jgi:hypothetical protein
MEMHKSNNRDSVESEKCWRGVCVVTNCGSFSEQASKRRARAADQGIEHDQKTPVKPFFAVPATRAALGSEPVENPTALWSR